MKRRAFIAGLGGAAALWPLAARAQQPKRPVIGFLNSAASAGYQVSWRNFNDGLKEAGFVDGQNVTIIYRWAEGHYDRLPALAAELVRQRVDVLVANTAASMPAKAATTSIPIVFNTSIDPVQIGLVQSLSRPGGNATGVTSLNIEVGPKRLELLREVLPGVSNIALLVNPTNPSTATSIEAIQSAAARIGLQIHVLRATSNDDVEQAFEQLVALRAGGLIISSDAHFSSFIERLAALSVRYKVPTIYQTREFVAAGGLMSYGGSLAEQYRLAGVYAGRILKGENVSTLPVQQATKLGLIINLKTAKALGLTIPLPLLGGADEVIE